MNSFMCTPAWHKKAAEDKYTQKLQFDSPLQYRLQQGAAVSKP